MSDNKDKRTTKTINKYVTKITSFKKIAKEYMPIIKTTTKHHKLTKKN